MPEVVFEHSDGLPMVGGGEGTPRVRIQAVDIRAAVADIQADEFAAHEDVPAHADEGWRHQAGFEGVDLVRVIDGADRGDQLILLDITATREAHPQIVHVEQVITRVGGMDAPGGGAPQADVYRGTQRDNQGDGGDLQPPLTQVAPGPAQP